MLKRLLKHPDPRGQLLPTTRMYLAKQISALQKGKLRLRIPKLEGQMSVVPNTHFHMMPELFLQVSGTTHFSFPNEQFRLLPGEICIVPRGMPHGEEAHSTRGAFHNFVFMYQAKFLLFHLAHAPDLRPRSLCGDSFECPAQRLAEYLDDAVDVFHDKGPHRDLRINALLLTHLSSLLAILEGERTKKINESQKVIQAKHFVATHLSDRYLSVSRIAQWINCSADYLSHLFHKETGKALSVHINELRVLQAKGLMENSERSIKEIAWACGYCDPGYFTRVFRRTVGATPQTYRTQQLKQQHRTQ